MLACYVSLGARASELLGVGLADVDWQSGRLWVISKGTRLRQVVPVSPEALAHLAGYLDEAGLPGGGGPVWRTRRGEPSGPAWLARPTSAKMHALDGWPPRSAGTGARFSAQEIASTLIVTCPAPLGPLVRTAPACREGGPA